MQKNKSSFNQWHRILWWKINSKDLSYQVENYSTLRLFYSYRKICSLIFLYVSFISLASYISSINNLNIVNPLYLINTLIFSSFAPFIWRGNRIAIKVGMVLWTYIQAYSMLQSLGNPNVHIYSYFINLFWWFYITGLLYATLKIEQIRK